MKNELTPERKAQILAERAKTDPCRQYKPGPTFLRYHQSDALYIAISTNNQTGKTTAIQAECAWVARQIHPYHNFKFPTRQLVVVPSRAQACLVWGQRLLKASELKGDAGKHPWIPKREIKKVNNAYSPMGPFPGSIELKNGSTIYFALSGDVNSWKRLEGAKFDRVYRDEADGSDNLADELQPRLLTAQTQRINGEKPGCGGIHWAATSTKPNDEWQSFREKCEAGFETPIGRYQLFCPDPHENPAVSREAREAMASTMSKEAYNIRGVGDGTAEDSLTIYARYWSNDRHVRKTPYEIGLHDNIWVAYDPGWRHPVGIGFFVLNREEPFKLRLVRYENYTGGSLREHVRTMVEFLDGRALTGLISDPSINRNLPTGIKHLTLLENELEAQGVRMHNPVMLGRNRLEDGIPQVVKVLEQGMLEVDPFGLGVEQYIREMLAYRWNEKAVGHVIHKKAKGGDEAPDITKYIVSRWVAWKDYGPNPCRGVQPLPGLPPGPEQEADPFAGLSPDERIHRMRLLESARLVDEHGHDYTSGDLAPIGLTSF